jgi:hypothetical protein
MTNHNTRKPKNHRCHARGEQVLMEGDNAAGRMKEEEEEEEEDARGAAECEEGSKHYRTYRKSVL